MAVYRRSPDIRVFGPHSLVAETWRGKEDCIYGLPESYWDEYLEILLIRETLSLPPEHMPPRVYVDKVFYQQVIDGWKDRYIVADENLSTMET